MIDINKIPSPCYVMEEKLLRNNLSLIKSVKERAGVNIILAFKAFALWKAFPIVSHRIRMFSDEVFSMLFSLRWRIFQDVDRKSVV